MLTTGRLVETDVRICINDVSYDSSSRDDSISGETDAAMLEMIRKQRRRCSWCPEEEKRKEEKHQRQRLLSVTGRSLSLSSLEGDDDDDGPGGEGDMAAGAPSDGTRTPPAPSSKAHKVRRSSRHRNDSLTSVGNSAPDQALQEMAAVLDGWIGMSPFGASMLDKYEGNSSVGASSMLSVPESGAQQTVSASASILDSCNCESDTVGEIVRRQSDSGDDGFDETTDNNALLHPDTCRRVTERRATDSHLYVIGSSVSSSSPSLSPLHTAPTPVSFHTTLSLTEEDEKTNSKEKKRRSSMFAILSTGKQRRSVKAGKSVRATHSFMSACVSNSSVCDVCGKSMVNKPAVQCENCLVSVHEVVCADQVLPCSKKRSERGTSSGRTKSVCVHSDGRQTGQQTAASENKKSSASIRRNASFSHASKTSSPSCRAAGGGMGYFGWRRVATKLGLDKALSEEQLPQQQQSPQLQQSQLQHMPQQQLQQMQQRLQLKTGSTSSLATDFSVNDDQQSLSVSMESLDEAAAEMSDLECELRVAMLEEDAEAWSVTVDKKTLRKMSAKDIKRQDHIWEFIQTEKNHFRTLKVMQKIFCEGLQSEVTLSQDVIGRLFPRLDDLVDIHTNFLLSIMERQRLRADRSIEDFGDLLIQQFEGEKGEKMKEVYGEFCSKQMDAAQLYKDLLKNDRKFSTFIKKCSGNSLLKRNGVPELMLLVAQRISKYPLLIQPILATTREVKEDHQLISQAQLLAKAICAAVDETVDSRLKAQRLIEIYNKLDARSFGTCLGEKFKKSDLLSGGRKLIHENVTRWVSARGKVQDVIMVLLSDVLFFLEESNQKYSFFSQDGKSGVIPLSHTLVREKGDTKDSTGLYIICQSKKEPEMYEITCRSADERRTWVRTIRTASSRNFDAGENQLSEREEERKLLEAKVARLRQLTDVLKQKDAELFHLCEDRLKVVADMMEVFGIQDDGQQKALIDNSETVSDVQNELAVAQVRCAVSRLSGHLHKLMVLTAVCPVEGPSDPSSGAITPPILQPKRAETFSGFENRMSGVVRRRHCSSAADTAEIRSQSANCSQQMSPVDNEMFLNVTSPLPRRRSLADTITQQQANASPPVLKDRRTSMGIFNSLLRQQQGYNVPATTACVSELPEFVGDCDIGVQAVAAQMGLILPSNLLAIFRDIYSCMAHLQKYITNYSMSATQHNSQKEILKAELAEARSKLAQSQADVERLQQDRKLTAHDKQLEELRNLQEVISQQKQQLEEEKNKQREGVTGNDLLLRQQKDTIDKQKLDLKSQHEELQRQRDALQRQIDLFEQRKAQATMDLAAQRASLLAGPLQHRKSDSPLPSRELLQYSLHVRSASGDSVSPHRVKETNIDSAILAFESSRTAAADMPAVKPRPLSSTLPGKNVSLNRRDSVPLHLLSATNEQKLVSSVAGAIPYSTRQSTPPGTRHTSSSMPSQLLPLKLSSVAAPAKQLAGSGRPATLVKVSPGSDGAVSVASSKQQTPVGGQTVRYDDRTHTDAVSSYVILQPTVQVPISNVLRYSVSEPEETFL